MRKHGLFHVILVFLLILSVQASNAHAWGPRAMRSIAAMSLQVIKDSFPSTFRPGGIVGPNFERDLMAGVSAGWQHLASEVPLSNEAEVMDAIATQIQLLREVQHYVPTAYFAYRMGMLASLTANLMLPYGFVWTDADKELRRQIIADIEANVDRYGFESIQEKRIFIREMKPYFAQKRSYMTEDMRLIAHDYNRTHLNYNGFLKQGGRAYYLRAVVAVADVWYTVLQMDTSVKDFVLPQPSERALTMYFINEMDYLLNEKNNMPQVEKVYLNFEKVNPHLTSAYERLGDIFYANDDETIKLRGVAEWKKAYDFGDVDRRRIGGKLSRHYMEEGKFYLNRFELPTAEETDLNSALEAFTNALNYDRANEDAASYIQSTNVAIRDRNARLEVALSIIATGERVHEEANRFREASDFANAISTYRQAIGFFEAIDDEFKAQYEKANENKRRLTREISDVINEVLDAASQAIDEGDRARDSKQFDVAIGSYQHVPSIVAVIPVSESPNVAKDVDAVIALSEKKVEEAQVEKLRYEQALQAAAEAQGQGGAPGQ
ncbi:MAG: hypothetical protein GX117_13940 [Candidatus Hydrogenedentes bacterium]|jgi:tetratricopeptide (TPR) repeat protein|nr:hypothetical protein [Candidatus Hydrogenedentota bacterium]